MGVFLLEHELTLTFSPAIALRGTEDETAFQSILGRGHSHGNFAEYYRSNPTNSALLCENFLCNLGELNGEQNGSL